MNFTEDALQFDCRGRALVGILGVPERPRSVGVVIVVGGPQYRVGSHRQFVQLARSLADAGHPVLRFDYRGMGDSEGEQQDFGHCTADLGAAISALAAAQPQVQRVVLWGLCDAASAALLYVNEQADARVAGLALLNPWVRSDASLAKTHVKHYYTQRLREPEFWRKLLSGQVAFGALAGFARSLRLAFAGGKPSAPDRKASYQERMAEGWQRFKGPVLLMSSERDHTAAEFAQYCADSAPWQRALKQRPPERVTIPAADHTCSVPGAKALVEAATRRWLDASFPAGCRTDGVDR